MPDSSELRALKRAVRIAGGQNALARALNMKQGQIWHWLNRKGKAPAEAVAGIEAATGVPRKELRPDIYA